MQTEGLKIVVGFQLDHANVLASVSDQFKQVERAAQGASGAFVKVAGSLRELDARQKSFVQFAKAGTLAYQQMGRDVSFAGNAVNRLSPSFNNAEKAGRNLNSAFAGLNNIVRDAPYGINGVANNITQLTDALFGASLAAQAVTLGISLAVTAAVTLSQKYGSLSNAIDELFGNLTGAEKAQRALTKAQDEGISNAQGELNSLDVLYRASQNLKLSLSERKEVVDALQKQYPKTFSNLSDEAILAGKAASAYENLREQIVAKAQFDALGSIITEEGKKFAEFSKKIREVDKRLIELRKSDSRLSDLSVLNDADVANESVRQAIEANLKLISQYRDEQKKIIDEQKILADEQQRFIQDSGTFVLDLGGDNSSKDIKTVSDVLSDLRKELTAVDQESKNLGLSFDQLNAAVLGPLEKAFEEIAKIGGPQAEKALQSIGEEIRKVRGEFISGETLQTKQLITFERAGKIKAIAPEFNADLVAVQQNAANFANTMGALGAKAAENFQNRFKVIGDSLSGAISPVIVELESLLENALSGIAVGIGDAIGGLITGAQGLTDVFNGLLKIIGTFIKEFGQALIVAATTRIIAEKSLVANPYLALAAGIAAVAAGAALQNIVPSFATGGTVMGPQLIMAGDNPGRKEHILSDAQLQTIAGSNVRDVRVYGVVRGRDIHLLNQEAINEGFRIN